MSFQRIQQPSKGNEKFSILIPTWNNLTYLKACVESIRKNSTFEHQIIVHVNDGKDGTLAWVQEQGFSHTHSMQNVGICTAMNAAAGLATTDYILYINDDMYVCPEWDKWLWDAVEKQGDEYFYLSATMIEHTQTTNKCVLSPYDFGKSIETFREDDLLAALPSMPSEDWSGSTWPPSLMHKNLWNLIGGFSIEFSPGMYSDPDISMKMWIAGVRTFKGVGKSKVYHFISKTTGKINRNNGRVEFFKKWGISNSSFYRYYLQMGKPVCELGEPERNFDFKRSSLRDRLKSIGYSIKGGKSVLGL